MDEPKNGFTTFLPSIYLPGLDDLAERSRTGVENSPRDKRKEPKHKYIDEIIERRAIMNEQNEMAAKAQKLLQNINKFPKLKASLQSNLDNYKTERIERS